MAYKDYQCSIMHLSQLVLYNFSLPMPKHTSAKRKPIIKPGEIIMPQIGHKKLIMFPQHATSSSDVIN